MQAKSDSSSSSAPGEAAAQPSAPASESQGEVYGFFFAPLTPVFPAESEQPCSDFLKQEGHHNHAPNYRRWVRCVCKEHPLGCWGYIKDASSVHPVLMAA